MPVTPRKRYLGPEQRRALLILAGIPFGATEAMMFTNGFERRTFARLIRLALQHYNAGRHARERICRPCQDN
jgi:hypothetical protein